MRYNGWLLDPYIKDEEVILWFKTKCGEALKLQDTYHPIFIVDPKKGFSPEDVTWLFEKHQFVVSSRVVQRHPDLRRDELRSVVEVKVEKQGDFKQVLGYAKRLREVGGIYNTGLMPIQWYLIYRGSPPSSLCRVEGQRGRVKGVEVFDDGSEVEPPPFKVMELRPPDSARIEDLMVLDEWGESKIIIRGGEKKVLTELEELVRTEDPDILVAPRPFTFLKQVQRRAKFNGIDLRLGQGGEQYRGRVLLSSSSFRDMGVAGLVERARFTYAPMGVSHDWEAGKTIDSRQCAEAVKLNIMVPPMRGGYAFSTWAWDLIRHDKGGMVFSPKPGLHENVAALDFESMFPNIIVKKNVSYETVDEDGVDEGIEGFLGSITEPFLERRLRFKHMRDRFPENSREWIWCQQRQSSLKLFLVVYYGYSGCYANRFANVRVFQEINRQARDSMVTALKIAQIQGFDVIYGPFDSLFVKKRDATRDDFAALAEDITEATKLPMSLDRYFRYLVLLNKTTDPIMNAVNRYYGKLIDGSLFYRGIELRRHDTPPFIYSMQERMIKAVFNYDTVEEVLEKGVKEAQRVAGETLSRVRRGVMDPRELVISKRLSRDLKDYSARQPHIVAAMLGGMEEMSRYILVNTKCSNPFMRVMPKSMIDDEHQTYDRRKYSAMTRRAAWNLLRTFIPDEDEIGWRKTRTNKLNVYF